jgi:hypothetical protein
MNNIRDVIPFHAHRRTRSFDAFTLQGLTKLNLKL